MRRAVAALALLLLAAGTQAARPPQRFSADPSAVVAAEIAFNRLAQDKGQWTAFRETAAKDAVMFVPAQVNALAWLKGRKDPPAPVKWQPEKIFMSCDGSVGVTTGAWQRPDGTFGYFTTIWRRDDKGRWKWVLDHGDTLATARPVSDMIAARLADCPRREGRGGPPPPPSTRSGPDIIVAAILPGTGQSVDGTLKWVADVRADGSRTLTVTLARGAGFEPVLVDTVGVPAS